MDRFDLSVEGTVCARQRATRLRGDDRVRKTRFSTRVETGCGGTCNKGARDAGEPDSVPYSANCLKTL